MDNEPSSSGSPIQPSHGPFAQAVALAVFGLLLFAAWKIASPFLVSLAWAVAIAVSVQPLHARFSVRIGKRPKLAAALVTLAAAAIVLVPVGLLFLYAADGIDAAGRWLSAVDLSTLAPPEWLRKVPIAGAALDQYWRDATTGRIGTIEDLQTQVAARGGWLAEQGLALGVSFVQILVAVLIVFPLLVGARKSAALVRSLSTAIAGARGGMLIDVAIHVIRGVSIGVVGVSLLATLALTLGLWIAGVGGLGLLAFVTFLVCMIQGPVMLVGFGVALWLWHAGAPGWALFVAVWGIGVNVAASVLEPYLISSKAGLPMTVMFVGVVGGFIAWGFIGIFIGATVLGVLYAITMAWIGGDKRYDDTPH